MLNSASDYKFVDASSVSNMIHGNIIPVTDPDANTPAPLYFENYLFLLEAFYERQNPELSAGSSSISVPPRTLNGGNIRALDLNIVSFYNGWSIYGPRLGYSNDRAFYINRNTVIPANDVKIGYNNKINIGGFMSGYSLVAPETKAPYVGLRPLTRYDDSRYHSVLYGEFMRAKFWAFDNMCKLIIMLRWGDLATAVTRTYLTESGSIESQDSLSLGNTILSPYRYYSLNSQGNPYLRMRTDLTYRNFMFTMPYATSAKLVIEGMASDRNDTSSTNAYVFYSMDLQIMNGRINTPGLDAIADAI